MPRRTTILFLFAITVLIFSATLLFGSFPQYGSPAIFRTPLIHDAAEENTMGNLHTDSQQDLISQPKIHRVTITETGGSHDEVVAALVHSFGSQPDVTIDLYQLLPRYGIKEIMNSFALSHSLPSPKPPGQFRSFGMEKARPDFFVAGTCELDIVDNSLKPHLETLLKEGKTYLFCVVHHADRWTNPKLKEAIRPWVEKNLVEFWSLSPHTAKFLREKSITRWENPTGVQPLVRYFVPVFPVLLATEPELDTGDMSFGMQGDYDPSRRDYSSIFEGLAKFLQDGGNSGGQTKSPNVTMHLLGHGTHPVVPEAIKNHVSFDERLSYSEYYSILSRTFALLPAFATNEYLDRKASSSVPAALIAGTPLVASQSIIDAYSYINNEIVWRQEDGETDLAVVGKILKLDQTDRTIKKSAVKKRCAEIIQENTISVGHWIKEAKQKL
ncbi:hypothetical protein EDC01DRAFT_127676 [Geopyxis carbonaria]|nr:hypothetical protein EDC01DRAFT_127676 [Geopyxis carbonaria]